MSIAKRVIKNTGYLYAKMAITVFISLYTTRLILNTLGVSDFGIFNIVGGAIGMLGFLNSTMANATQRFMSYAEGEGNLENKRKVFNVSLLLHVAIALVTALMLISAMYPFFNGILNIELERVLAAKVVYFSLICSTMLTIVNIPYDAVMNAHENMLYYSLVGIFESFLRLSVAFACVYTSHDKLIVYGFLMAVIPLVTLSIMNIYCHKHYDECIISPKRYWDGHLVKEIALFSGWNFLTAISSLFSAQGIGIVLNHFFGSALNAAQGIAQQLNGQLSAFSGNMIKALNPVIVKKAGAGDVIAMNTTIIVGCKYSTFLIMLFAIPFIIEMKYILKTWLKDVPDWAALFCVLQLIQTLICQLAQSAATAIYAQGDIKWYAVYKSIMNSLPVIVTYVSFSLGGGPYWLYIPMIVIWAIGGDIIILKYAKEKCDLSIANYIKYVIFPIMGVAGCMSLFGYLVNLFFPIGFLRLVITCVATTIGMLLSMITIGMTKEEKFLILTLKHNLLMKITHTRENLKIK